MSVGSPESVIRPVPARTWVLGFVAALLVVVVYARALHGDFLWDDDSHIYANPSIVGPLGLKEIWTSASANYFPLTTTTFWLVHAIAQLNPVAYHVATLLFHVASVLLLWRVLQQLAIPSAWLGALCWGLHPVQVESVAWICELKNTQSGCCFLLAILFFNRWVRSSGPLKFSRDYVFAWVAGILAILSKSSTVMLPAVLALLGWWLGRRRWRDAVWLVPFLAVSAVAAGWTVWEQKVHSMASGPEWSHGIAARLIIAGKVPWFYLGKLLWPYPLVFIYPRWGVEAHGFVQWLPLVGTVAVCAMIWRLRDSCGRRGWFLALGYFGVSLFPVLGLFDVFYFKYSFVADHFQYLASMGPLALLGAGLGWAFNCCAAPSVRARAGVAVAVVLPFALLTRGQTSRYLNREILWTETVRRNAGAYIAQINLGTELLTTGRPGQAMLNFQNAARLKPGDALALANWGTALVQTGQLAEGIGRLEAAVRIMPGLAEAHNTLGLALAASGRPADGIEHLRQAVQLKPAFESALTNLANTLTANGRGDEAEHAFVAAVQGNPDDFALRAAFANFLLRQRRHREAIEHGRAALHLRPRANDVRVTVANALLLSGQPELSVSEYQEALRHEPGHVDAHGGLGNALYQLRRPAEALPHYAMVVDRSPRSAGARNNLGSALMQLGRLAEAIQQYDQALQLEPDYLDARANLALALEKAGRNADALQQYEEILRKNPNQAVARAGRERLRRP